MVVKLNYRLLVLLLLLTGIKIKVFGEDIAESSENYRFFTSSANESDTELFPKKKSFLDKSNELPRKRIKYTDGTSGLVVLLLKM